MPATTTAISTSMIGSTSASTVAMRVLQLLVVEVGDRGEHVAEGARLLAHLDHLQGQVVEHARRLEGGGEALPLADLAGRAG